MTINDNAPVSRREFLISTAGLLLAGKLEGESQSAQAAEPVIDIHQHTHYSGRSDQDLIAHQKSMGVTMTILLPAGRFYGLDAECGGNDTVVALAKKYPLSFKYFANEVADHPAALKVVRAHLRRGAIGIGEQKFRIAC